MRLKEIFEIYKLKKELPTEEELTEIFEDLKPEPISKPLEMSEVKNKLTIPFNVKEGDIIQIFPSVDGLDMYLLVWNVSEEEDIVRLMLISEFTEFATPKDVKITIDGREYIVQTDIFADFPYKNLRTALGRLIFKLGQISEEVLQRVDKVFYGEENGDGTFITPTKALFKREEAERLSILVSEYIQRQEKYYENLEYFKLTLEEKPRLAASEKERYTILKELFYAKYDREKEILVIKPVKNLVYSIGKVILKVDGKELILYEGVIYERIPLPLPKELYNWEILEKGLKLEVY